MRFDRAFDINLKIPKTIFPLPAITLNNFLHALSGGKKRNPEYEITGISWSFRKKIDGLSFF